MTTATVINHERFLRRESARHEAIADGDRNQSDEQLKKTLKACLKRRDDHNAFKGSAKRLRDAIDAAVAKHAETTAPLQTELADDATTPERRIDLRVAVNEANSVLETTIAPWRKSLEAVEQEMTDLAARGINPAVIENAYAGNGPDVELARVYEAVEQIMANVACFPADKRAEDFAIALRNERERQSKSPRKDESAIREAERRSNHANGVAKLLKGFLHDARAKRDAIREQRIAELYK